MEDRDIAKKFQVMHQQKKPQEAAGKGRVIQLIVFHLGEEEFGADIAQVREIIRAGTVTPIPDSPDFIKGITNVRGEIAVVIDLKKRFFLRTKEVEERHIIMTEQEKNLFGLMVDEVTEVLRIPESDIKTTPELVTKIDRIYISGVLTLESRLIIMLDLSKVLSEEELAKLSEIRIRHRQAIERATLDVADKKAADIAEPAIKGSPERTRGERFDRLTVPGKVEGQSRTTRGTTTDLSSVTPGAKAEARRAKEETADKSAKSVEKSAPSAVAKKERKK